MLCYVFHSLSQGKYEDVKVEHFHNQMQLYASILISGMSATLKSGLRKEYVGKIIPLSMPQGKIDLLCSNDVRLKATRKVVCTCDEYCVDSYENRIIKTTLRTLLKADVLDSQKASIHSLLKSLDGIQVLCPKNISWKMSCEGDSNAYGTLISICHLIIADYLQTEISGDIGLSEFYSDKTMHDIYEKFVREYYRRHYPGVSVSASKVRWNLIEEEEYSDRKSLPEMKTDTFLKFRGQVLIIDTKYYGKTDSKRSENLYQMYSYVKNEAANLRAGKQSKEEMPVVDGLILYAQTKEDKPLVDYTYNMDGNRIGRTTLNLNQDFSRIVAKLDNIVSQFFGIECKKVGNF
ncbi:hypothetical protein CRD60_07635 [Bifidobacterium aemilianum]|uniref:5-methylcytosine-specific restriction endonuclease system specificity protein McrC n=2 Tax=Bifidobacterium aemilianum TaxID=2493120 RepID=A0A366K6I6_9BIFI|nr:hypothetical protein CRD60_07635 [Bifidobacterium aemilianum]